MFKMFRSGYLYNQTIDRFQETFPLFQLAVIFVGKLQTTKLFVAKLL